MVRVRVLTAGAGSASDRRLTRHLGSLIRLLGRVLLSSHRGFLITLLISQQVPPHFCLLGFLAMKICEICLLLPLIFSSLQRGADNAVDLVTLTNIALAQGAVVSHNVRASDVHLDFLLLGECICLRLSLIRR